MKYMVAALAITILLTATGLALECQYTENETDQRTQLALVLENSLIKKGDVLNISDFISGEQSTFTVYNPNDFEIFAKFMYNVSGHSGGSKEKGLKLEARSYTIFKHYCFDGTSIGNCSIDSNSVNYQVVQPYVMVQREVQVPYNRTMCRKCCQGDCLNDDTQCSRDCECGSNLCNIARTCGQTWIAPCPDGSVNCNNQSCLKPSTKEVGEGYACEWECKSSVGSNSVCAKNQDMINIEKTDLARRKIIFGLASALTALCIAAGFWYVKRKGIDPLNDQIRKLNDEIQGKRMERERLSDSIAKGENEITSLKDHLRRAEGAAREKFEAELSKQGALQKELKKQLQETQTLLDKEYEQLDEKYVRQLKGRFGEKKVAMNGNGYPVFSDSEIPIHRWFYEKEYRKKYNRSFDKTREVHHIDANRKNSLDFANLIDLTEEEHKKVDTGKIPRGDWKQGIKELMRALEWKESDLPPHIRERYNNISSNKKK